MDGSFVLMDIAAAQLAFARLGRIDRIDVQIATSADGPRCLAGTDQRRHRRRRIGHRRRGCRPGSPPAGRPPRPAGREMLAAFHLNLAALSWVALVVGLFLVYNTATMYVLARREEVGMLRALGVTRRQVLGLFLGEAAVLGVAGTVLGIGLGRAARRLGRRRHRRHRQHALHRHRGGAAGADRSAHVALAVRHRPAAVAAGRGAAGARGVAGAADGGDPRQRPARGARAAAARGRSSRRCCPRCCRWRWRGWGRSTAGRSSATPRRSRRSSARRCWCRRSLFGLARVRCAGRCAALLGVEGLLAHAHLAVGDSPAVDLGRRARRSAWR